MIQMRTLIPIALIAFCCPCAAETLSLKCIVVGERNNYLETTRAKNKIPESILLIEIVSSDKKANNANIIVNFPDAVSGNEIAPLFMNSTAALGHIIADERTSTKSYALMDDVEISVDKVRFDSASDGRPLYSFATLNISRLSGLMRSFQHQEFEFANGEAEVTDIVLTGECGITALENKRF